MDNKVVCVLLKDGIKVKLYDEDPRISYDDETIYITSVDKRIIGIFDRCELGFVCVLNA